MTAMLKGKFRHSEVSKNVKSLHDIFFSYALVKYNCNFSGLFRLRM